MSSTTDPAPPVVPEEPVEPKSLVTNGFYLVSYRTDEGWGNIEVIISEPKEPKVFLKLVRAQLNELQEDAELVIIAVSKIS